MPHVWTATPDMKRQQTNIGSLLIPLNWKLKSSGKLFLCPQFLSVKRAAVGLLTPDSPWLSRVRDVSQQKPLWWHIFSLCRLRRRRWHSSWGRSGGGGSKRFILRRCCASTSIDVPSGVSQWGGRPACCGRCFSQYVASLPLQHVAASAVAVSLEGRTRTGLFFFFFLFFLFHAIYAVPALPLEVRLELIRLVSIAPRPLSQHATAAAASFKTGVGGGNAFRSRQPEGGFSICATLLLSFFFDSSNCCAHISTE